MKWPLLFLAVPTCLLGNTLQLPAQPTPAQTRAFMKELARYVFDNHLRQEVKSEQRGMIYEYFDLQRKGQFDQWVQGEALDTMHDGAWFAAALVNAYRATGDAYYKDFLTRWVLPFYCKMLNHSDTLFSARRNDARPGAHTFDKEHQLQTGEKGFGRNRPPASAQVMNCTQVTSSGVVVKRPPCG